MKVLVINGSNLNMLGLREPDLYGNNTYEDLENYIKSWARIYNIYVDIYQSNCEGDLVTKIQKAYGNYQGIIINGGAYSHTSIAILDALQAVNIPTVEVHLTDITTRENFRKNTYISHYAQVQYVGLGFQGYKKALEYFQGLKDL